jgi:glutamate racemase
LGCTHYPIIAGAISEYLSGVTLINSGAEAAKQAMGLIANNDEEPSVSYFVSDDPASFEKNASIFLGREINGIVTKVNIEEF